MADGLRRSNRLVKVREEPNFVYDTESINFLLNSVEGQGEIAHHRLTSDSHNSEVFNSACENPGYSAITTAVSWVNLSNTPVNVNSGSGCEPSASSYGCLGRCWWQFAPLTK